MLCRAHYTLVWATILAAQDLPVTTDTIVAQVQAKVAENISRLPDFVCNQTVERARRESARDGFRLRDTLRLEVTLLGGRERYAWRDARNFDDRELRDLVGSGMIGTGTFALHTQHVFQPRVAQFHPRGEVALDGRRALRYDYDVAWENSAYRIRNPPNEHTVAFRGSFLVDAETLDLLRLEILADEIPPELGFDRVSSLLEYTRVTIGSWNGVLPKWSELTMTGLDGTESRNQTKIGDCREYRAESQVVFDLPDATAERHEPAPSPDAVDLARRLVIELELDSDIRLDAAAPGDPVRAMVTTALKDQNRVIAPEGSLALGHIVRLEKLRWPLDYYEIAFEFRTLETSQGRYGLSATMMNSGTAPGMIRQVKQFDPTFTRDRRPKMDILVRQVQRGQGILQWDARRPQIRKGLKMRWLIDDLKPETAVH